MGLASKVFGGLAARTVLDSVQRMFPVLLTR